MRKMRVVLGLVLAAVLLLGFQAYAFAAEFQDIEDHDYEASIINMSARGFVGGYDDGTFRPDNFLQRQQFAKMAVLTLGYEVTAEDVSTFPDTPAPYDPVNNPLYPGSYVAVAAANEIIKGYTNGNFGFTDYVTRQQAISIIVRAAGEVLAEAPDDWAGDLDYSNEFHGANVKKAEYNGLLAGIVDLATWDLTANATRGEAAELLSQLYYRTGQILKLGDAEGTKIAYTMDELKALPATEGYGGTKNKVGTIVAPKLYKGVAIKDLMAEVGGGVTIKAIATDGYEIEYTADEINGILTMFDPATGEEKTEINGELTMILAYEVDGQPLPSYQGALRIAFVSPEADQLTTSSKWASQIIGIVVQAAEEAPEE